MRIVYSRFHPIQLVVYITTEVTTIKCQRGFALISRKSESKDKRRNNETWGNQEYLESSSETATPVIHGIHESLENIFSRRNCTYWRYLINIFHKSTDDASHQPREYQRNTDSITPVLVSLRPYCLHTTTVRTDRDIWIKSPQTCPLTFQP